MPSRIRYRVAASLDGRIEGPQGEIDWIVGDPEIDFQSIMKEFDTVLVGRQTFETMVRVRRTMMPGMKTIVLSRTLHQSDYPEVAVIREDHRETLDALRIHAGKDIWLFGGGSLFRSLLEWRMVDTVEVAIMPALLGGGVPLVYSREAGLGPYGKLTLEAHQVYKSGIVSLTYAVR